MSLMRSALYQVTIPLEFLIIIHNYANVRQSTNQNRVVATLLDGINSWSIQMLLRGETDSKQLHEIQVYSL